mmetsp:Transcript_51989/g.108598  ORF Transcript_51989/g.108598 Transcript_51989/m.108598 type:complete len:96 (-) Transcript_51989:247-534(-)
MPVLRVTGLDHCRVHLSQVTFGNQVAELTTVSTGFLDDALLSSRLSFPRQRRGIQYNLLIHGRYLRSTDLYNVLPQGVIWSPTSFILAVHSTLTI